MTKVVELLGEGICFLLKYKCDRVDYTLEGIRQNIMPSLFDLPTSEQVGEAIAHVAPAGDRWFRFGYTG